MFGCLPQYVNGVYGCYSYPSEDGQLVQLSDEQGLVSIDPQDNSSSTLISADELVSFNIIYNKLKYVGYTISA